MIGQLIESVDDIVNAVSAHDGDTTGDTWGAGDEPGCFVTTIDRVGGAASQQPLLSTSCVDSRASDGRLSNLLPYKSKCRGEFEWFSITASTQGSTNVHNFFGSDLFVMNCRSILAVFRY